MSKLRDFAPILIVICCAAVFGTLLMTGVIDLNSIPTLVEHRPVLAVCVVLLFFIIPIKVKYLAYLDAALFVFGVITMSFPLNLLPVVAVLNYLVYCGDWLFDFFRPSHVRQRQKTVNFKREARRIQREQANKPYHYKCAVCGRTDADHPELEFRYCSRCVGYHCFCQDHINNHIHFTE